MVMFLKSKMNSVLAIAMGCVMTCGLWSCGESAKEREQREKIDSLQNENVVGQMRYEDLEEYLTIIAEGLDSIELGEDDMRLSMAPGENTTPNKRLMKEKLERVQNIVDRHRTRIAELEQKLANQEGDAKKLHTIVSSLQKQLAQKDRELADLRAELDDSRRDVANLRSTITEMEVVQNAQEQTIEDQKNTIQQQADKMNTGYIKMATKKELKAEGLLTGGFLKKKKVDYSQIDLSKFKSVDIRSTQTISLPKKFKLLTPVPEASYVVESNGSGNTLQVTDPALFWSVSNFLIIQID